MNNSDKKKSILVIAVGQSDIKVLCRYDDNITHYATEVDKRSHGDFSQYLLDNKGTGSYTLESIARNKNPEQLRDDIARSENAKKERRDIRLDIVMQDGHPLLSSGKEKKELPTPLRLIPIKLFPIVYDALKEDQPYTIDTVIIFNTHRINRDGSNRSDEPFAFGEILAEWLSEELNLKSPMFIDYEGNPDPVIEPEGAVLYCNCLYGGMNFKSDGKNFPLNRETASIIDDLLNKVQRHNPDHHLICFPAGGIPAIKEQVMSACQFYFNSVETRTLPKNNQNILNSDTAGNEFRSAEESYHARKKAISLINRGNFEGAQVIAEVFDAGKERISADSRWAEKVKIASHWLQGTRSIDALNNVLPNSLPFDKDTLPNTLWAAFRIEAALRYNNIQDAIRYTCDLADIALIDLLAKQLQRPANQISTLDKVQIAPKFADRLESALLNLHKPETDSKQRLIEHHPNEGYTLRINTHKQYSFTKAKVAEIKTENRKLLPDLLCLLDLKGTETAFYHHPLSLFEHHLSLHVESGDDKSNARKYRNKITHGYLPSEKVNQASAHFRHPDIALWASIERTLSPGGMQFLNQPVFTNLYACLDNQNQPAQLYARLVASLKESLINSPLKD